MVAIGIAIIARSGAVFERTRRAISRDEVVQIPQSRAEPLLSAALAIAVVFLASISRALSLAAHDSNRIPMGECHGYENRQLVRHSCAPRGLIIRQKDPNNLEMPFDQLGDFITPSELSTYAVIPNAAS